MIVFIETLLDMFTSTVNTSLSEKMLPILPRKYYICLSNNSQRFIILIQELDSLSDFQRACLIARFISITEEFKKRMIIYGLLFHIGRFIVTGGSLIVPALLSIQTPSGTSVPMFWTTWSLSLLVTLSNAILTLFKVEKRYYYINTCIGQLYSEFWQYIELTGKYNGKHSGNKLKPLDGSGVATHQNQYGLICRSIEKIKLKQIEDEFFKVNQDSIHSDPKHPETGTSDSSQGHSKDLTIPLLSETQKELFEYDDASTSTTVKVEPSDSASVNKVDNIDKLDNIDKVDRK
jgi:hypothetical protein